LTLGTHAAAVSLARNHHLPFYDALIVASAIEAGCDTLYSEDMQDGRVIGGLISRNGFAETSRILPPSTICSWRAAQLPASGRAFQNS
jgi:predicted nucleic acid-binding protein